MAVTVYRSTDASAPVALPNSPSIISILYACLVTGYGSKAGSGWTRPYTGTKLAVFRQPAGTSNFYLRVDENTASNRAILRGYETMTAVSTGSRLFPTTAQEPSPGGMFIAKGSADNAPMEWIVVATGAAFWLFIKPRSSGIGDPYYYAIPFFFGDIESYKPADLYKCAIFGGLYSVENSSGADPGTGYFLNPWYQDVLSIVTGYHRCLARSHTAVIGSSPFGVHNTLSRNNVAIHQGGVIPFPNPVDGGIYLSKLYAHEMIGGNGVIRGNIPGIWQISHSVASFTIGDTFNGTGEFVGKTFEFVRVLDGIMAIETSNTW